MRHSKARLTNRTFHGTNLGYCRSSWHFRQCPRLAPLESLSRAPDQALQLSCSGNMSAVQLATGSNRCNRVLPVLPAIGVKSSLRKPSSADAPCTSRRAVCPRRSIPGCTVQCALHPDKYFGYGARSAGGMALRRSLYDTAFRVAGEPFKVPSARCVLSF